MDVIITELSVDISGLKKTEEEEDSTWDKSMTVLGELIGTSILVFLGCMACMGSMKPYIPGIGPSMIQVSFAFGLAVMIAIQMITPSDLVHGGDPTTTDKFCATDINEAIGIGHGIAAEAFATGVLVFFACSSWDSRNAKNTDSLGLKFGLCVAMLCLAFTPHTGCSMNPARSFGPAVWTGYWHYHWLYWLGPIGGSIIATLIYRYLFFKNQENTQDVETLNDIET
ncbi:PREDICTED: aquaporin-4-like isoform X2 [Acromyrmex echinatior]|uniref:aquaporin-4-like isoform X2 n=1 Tax=Acromyrmex echinatior TaxID=103372 RepID=UPI000580FECB|nr:PREDICTED: aquaporin-4-like isoform X2 [Acromyrmex echinatior]